MFINTNISEKSTIIKQNFGQNTPDILASENTTNPILNKEVNLNNTPSVQNKVIVQNYQPDYKELETFTIPNIGEGKIYELKNGHKVIILAKPGPTAIYTHVKVGGINDPKVKEGLSHFVEHMIALPEKYAKIGAEYNAVTDSNTTIYYVKYPVTKKEELDNLIIMQANSLQKPDFSQEKVDKQKAIIQEEFSRSANTNIDKTTNLLFNNLFNQFYEKSGTLGTEQTINSITRKDVVDHYDNFYRPDNMVTIIVGDVDSDNTIKIVSKYFDKEASKKPQYIDNNYPNFSNPTQKTKRVDLKSDKTTQAFIQMAFVGSYEKTPRNILLSQITGNVLENSKLLKKSLEPANGSAYISTSPAGMNENDPTIIAIISWQQPGNENKSLKGIYSSVYDLQQNSVSEKELKKAKMQAKKVVSDTSENSSYLAETLGSDFLTYGSLDYYTNINANIDSITSKDVQEFAQKYLDLDKASIVVEHPASSKISFGSSKSTPKESIQEYKLSNNLRLFVDNSLGVVKTTADLALKSDKIAQAKPGVAYMLDVMISESIHNSNNHNFEDYMALNGLHLTSDLSRNALSITAQSSGENAPQAVEAMEAVLYFPDFDENKFERLKKIIKKNLKEEAIDPFTQGNEAIGNLRNGYFSKEILENIDNVTLQDVKNLHKEIISNSMGTATITLPNETFQKSKEQIFNSLAQIPRMQESKPTEENPLKPLSKSQIFIKVKNTDQAIIKEQFQIKKSGNIKDHAAIALLDIILGGNMNSRIMQDLREKQKISYAAYCEYKNIGQKNGVFSLYTETKTENGDKAENLQKSLNSFHSNINDLINKPVSEEELDIAKLHYKNAIFVAMESSEKRNDLLQNAADSYYGIEYISELLKAIEEIKPEHVQRAAKLFLDKPSVISIEASKETIEKNKEYLEAKGEINIF